MKNNIFIFSLLSALSLNAEEKPDYKKSLIKQYVKVEVKDNKGALGCRLVFGDKKDDKDIIKANFDRCLDMAAFDVVKDLAAITKNLSFDLRIASIFTDLNSSIKYNMGLVDEFKLLYKNYLAHSKKYVPKLLVSQENNNIKFLTNFFNGLQENNMLAHYLVNDVNLMESADSLASVITYFIKNPNSAPSFKKILAETSKFKNGNVILYQSLLAQAIAIDVANMTELGEISDFNTLKQILTFEYGIKEEIKKVPFGGRVNDNEMAVTGSLVKELTENITSMIQMLKNKNDVSKHNILTKTFNQEPNATKKTVLKTALNNALLLIKPRFTLKEWVAAINHDIEYGKSAVDALDNELRRFNIELTNDEIKEFFLIK